jgi:hypothetical protein
MSTNLVIYVMQFLTPDMVGRIASALGINRSDAQSGVTASVPALLAAFSGLADKPGGAQSLVNTIKQQSSVVDNFGSMIGGSNQASFIERGSSLLTSLLGTHDSTSLASAVGRFAGLGQTRATSLLGMLAPLVMGLIGKQIGARGIDVGSLTSMLAAQRDQIAQALPSGMGQMLESAGLGGGFEPVRTTTAAPAGTAAGARPSEPYRSEQYRESRDQYRSGDQYRQQYPTSRPVTTERSTRAEPGVPNWVYWLLPLLVLGGLLWYLLGRPHEQQARQEPSPQTTQQPQTTGQAPQATGNVVVGGVDVKNTLGDSLSDVRTSLQGVTDTNSAQAALPKLEAAKNQIDRVSNLTGQLSSDQKRTLAGVVASAMPMINQLSDKVMGIQGVSDVLKPTIDPMKQKLAELEGQPSTTGSGR